MDLKIQIYSLFYSFFFGIILYFLLNLFNKYTVRKNVFLKIILSFLFVIVLSLIYFIGLLYINNGCLHVYFFVFILVGYLIVYFINAFWFTYKRRK